MHVAMSKRTYILGFSRKYHFMARAIMWFTRSEYSHCYVRQVDDGVDYVLEADSHGVNIQWFSVFHRDGSTIMREYEVIGIDIESLDRAWATVCYERLNRPYSYMQILGDAIVIAWRVITKRRIANPFGQPWADVCSELALQWLLAVPVKGFDKFDPGTVTPEELARRAHAVSQHFRPRSLDELRG
jgi:hypothetical protein